MKSNLSPGVPAKSPATRGGLAEAAKSKVHPVVVDIHGHMLDVAFRNRRPLQAALGGNTDVPSMRRGGVTAQLCANWTPDASLSGPHDHSVAAPLATLLDVLGYLHRELNGAAGEHVLLARKGSDLRQAADTGRIALIVGMEGTDALEGDVAVLRKLYELGLRHVGLVHERANEFGTASQVWEGGEMRRYDPARDPAQPLTDKGRALITEMKRLGVVIDVMHLAGPSFLEVVDFVDRPVIVSHGGARGITDSVRYLSDEQIRAVARVGGLIGASPTPLGPSTEQPGLPLLLDTVDYLVKLVGTAHVGIGTDFKDTHGYYPPDFASSADTPALVKGLESRGYNESEIERICGGNFLRVFEQVAG